MGKEQPEAAEIIKIQACIIPKHVLQLQSVAILFT